MSEIAFEPDEIGPWSEIKLEIIEKYGPAYTQAFSSKGRNLRKFYIDEPLAKQLQKLVE